MAALPDGGVVSGNYDGELLVFSLRDRAGPRRLKLSDVITSVAVLPGSGIVSGNDAGMLRICDLNSHTATRQLGGHAKRVTSIAVLPDGRIISGGCDRTLRLWDATSAEQVSCLHMDATPLVIVPDSARFSCVFDSLGGLHRVGFA